MEPAPQCMHLQGLRLTYICVSPKARFLVLNQKSEGTYGCKASDLRVCNIVRPRTPRIGHVMNFEPCFA